MEGDKLLYLHLLVWSWDSLVSTVTGLWTGWSGIWYRARGRDYFPPQNVQAVSGAHPASYSVGNGSYIPGGKVARHKVDHSPPSTAKVKKEWSRTSTSLWFHGMDRDNFTCQTELYWMASSFCHPMPAEYTKEIFYFYTFLDRVTLLPSSVESPSHQ